MVGKRRNRNKLKQGDFVVASATPASHRENDKSDDDESADVESLAAQASLDGDAYMAESDGDQSSDDQCESASVEDRFSDSVDNLFHKNSSVRLAALENIKGLLSKSYWTDKLEKWKSTLIDIVDKNLRRSDTEVITAADIASLLALQLGNAISEDIGAAVVTMQQICSDSSRHENVRTQCAQSVALCSYICLEQPNAVMQSISVLRSVWITWKTNSSSTSLFKAALYGWVLLIHQADRKVLEAALLDQPKLCSFVDGAQIEMRLTAGEALAVIHESATEKFEGYRFPNQQHLLEILSMLATDSVKYRAKKDRKLQRSSFRQIFSAIQDGQPPSLCVKFGSEAILLETYGIKLFYDLVCGVLKSGMNSHLKSNLILREIFDLGPICEEEFGKATKLQKKIAQNSLSKSRDLHRAKQRDKRAC